MQHLKLSSYCDDKCRWHSAEQIGVLVFTSESMATFEALKTRKAL